MLKKTLVALALLAAAASPALASTESVFGNANPTEDQLQFIKSSIVHQLKDQGVNATDVAEWGNYIRADVTSPDGTSHVRFFDPDPLHPVDLNHLT